MNISTRRICVLALGIALFCALSMCLQVPVFENYYLCLGYIVMAVYCYSFGTLSGTAAGTLGVILYCLLINGLRGMPGWALGNIVIGVILGLTFRATKSMKSLPVKTVLNAAAVIVSAALGILIVKSLTESLLYAQPMAVRIGKNIYAFVADVVMLLVSLPVCMSLDRTAKKLFPELVK
ncbi:MAG: ECF transporter S component [Clostridia bacterium]|nr:ECF transporter S component [Clostridia bacterium]